jgi:cell wall-associated protease
MIKRCHLSLLVVFFILGCTAVVQQKNIPQVDNNLSMHWEHKDFYLDAIPGTSLDKWYAENKTKNKKNQIIVAVLDTQIDIEHEALKMQLWTNTNEIPNNKIDDDNNGYIDDIHGWNFVGKPNGGYFAFGNYEYTRIIKKWDDEFKNKDKTDIPIALQHDFEQYEKSKRYRNYYLDYYTDWRKSLEFSISVYPSIKDSLKLFFPKEDYSSKDLDSLYKIYKKNDKPYWQLRDDNDRDLGSLIYYEIVNLEQKNKKIDDLIDSKGQLDSIINQNLNVNFIDRIYIKDNPTILDKGYGNPNISSFPKLQQHSTEVSSVVTAPKIKNTVTKGFHKNIKIMPLSISISGDEHDKDIANAIYYAVDNGAKVINMSFGKQFSLHQEWVSDALKYAEKQNVLIVHVSGNNSTNIDEKPYYPNDIEYARDKKAEIVKNFINVGSISKRTDSTMVSKFSNYGKQNVDLFAPGEEIYVAKPGNEYGYDSGTSLAAPMVSGTAALIWLYYPKLTVHEVKNIILESGVTIDKMVIKPGTKDEMVPFSELSKTGKILNTYNAMKMAEEVSKKKK